MKKIYIGLIISLMLISLVGAGIFYNNEKGLCVISALDCAPEYYSELCWEKQDCKLKPENNCGFLIFEECKLLEEVK